MTTKMTQAYVCVEGLDGVYPCYVRQYNDDSNYINPYFTVETVEMMAQKAIHDVKVYFDSDQELVHVFYVPNITSQLDRAEPLTAGILCDCMEVYRPDVLSIDGETLTLYNIGAGWLWHKHPMMHKFSMQGSDIKVALDADANIYALDVARALNDVGFYTWDAQMVREIEGAICNNRDIHIGPVSVTYELLDVEICK